MRYRNLGKTGLKVSEIGLGAEWLERHSTQEVKAVVEACHQAGINILDCWMPGCAHIGRFARWNPGGPG